MSWPGEMGAAGDGVFISPGLPCFTVQTVSVKVKTAALSGQCSGLTETFCDQPTLSVLNHVDRQGGKLNKGARIHNSLCRLRVATFDFICAVALLMHINVFFLIHSSPF